MRLLWQFLAAVIVLAVVVVVAGKIAILIFGR